MGNWNRFDYLERSLRWKTGLNEQPGMVFADWNQERPKLVHNQSLFEPFLQEASAFLCQNRILRFYNIIYFYYKIDYILHLYIIFYLIIFLICGEQFAKVNRDIPMPYFSFKSPHLASSERWAHSLKTFGSWRMLVICFSWSPSITVFSMIFFLSYFSGSADIIPSL